jgi:hypothetical protein
MKHLNVPAKFAFAMILTAAAVTGCKKQEADPVTPEATSAPTPAPSASPAAPAATPDATTPPAAGTTPTDATTPPAATTPESTPPAR